MQINTVIWVIRIIMIKLIQECLCVIVTEHVLNTIWDAEFQGDTKEFVGSASINGGGNTGGGTGREWQGV